MDYYNSIAKSYNELHGAEQKKKLAIIASHLAVSKDDKLLDVGCGTGLSSDFPCKEFGIDPSLELLKQAPFKSKAVAMAEHLPFKDKSFDTVISVTALHHTDVAKALEEIKRVGKNRFVFSLLKKSPSVHTLKKAIAKTFPVAQSIEEDKDIIFFCNLSRV